jgi:hypothetical protein
MANVINATSTGNGGLVSTGDDSGILNIQTNETTAITVDASQRVAFVAGTAALPAITTTGDTNTGIFFPAADTIAFSEGGSESMRIDSSGNLLVGTTTTGAANTQGLFLNSASGATYASIGHVNGTGSGNGYMIFLYNGANIGYISQNGTTAVAYNTSSDYRLKENIAPMTGALDKVAQLKPVTYKWKTNGSDGQGFIAHELQAVVPDCVAGEKDAVDSDGKPVYQGIDTSFLVATLTAAIQEQQATINALTARIVALETA